MDAVDFSKLTEARLAACMQMLNRKATEYAAEEDRLSNFKRAGMLQGVEPETALLGMWAKHLVSVIDIVEKIEMGEELPSSALVAEKITDTINYAILLEGLIEERRTDENTNNLGPPGSGQFLRVR